MENKRLRQKAFKAIIEEKYVPLIYVGNPSLAIKIKTKIEKAGSSIRFAFGDINNRKNH